MMDRRAVVGFEGRHALSLGSAPFCCAGAVPGRVGAWFCARLSQEFTNRMAPLRVFRFFGLEIVQALIARKVCITSMAGYSSANSRTWASVISKVELNHLTQSWQRRTRWPLLANQETHP
ncbi:hypothetical protein [Stenotrophomonas maltophilia group sp. vghtpe118]|uniref:hypothetical protein n=1 Tax=Stenotrophomonas maltophilia group sp. vghtpe118 TaxID=3459469 RepID=UPI0040430063